MSKKKTEKKHHRKLIAAQKLGGI